LQALVGLLGKGGNGLPQVQEQLFGLAHKLDEDVPVAATAAAKAPHDFFEFLPQALDLPLESRGAATALLCDVGDEL
jgi:hypothetical protein